MRINGSSNQDSISEQKLNLSGSCAGISQKELAELTGVPPSTISQVEKSLIYPSLPALCRIAENLSVEVATLFKEHGERKNVYVYPVDSRSVTSLTKNVKDNAEADLLIPPDIDTPGEAIIQIRPGKKLPGHFFAHKGPELGYLLSGQLEMTVGNQSYKISPGDTIYLQKDIPGRWNNISEEVAELLWLKFVE